MKLPPPEHRIKYPNLERNAFIILWTFGALMGIVSMIYIILHSK